MNSLDHCVAASPISRVVCAVASTGMESGALIDKTVTVLLERRLYRTDSYCTSFCYFFFFQIKQSNLLQKVTGITRLSLWLCASLDRVQPLF